ALPPPRPIRMEGNPFLNSVNKLRAPGGLVLTGLGGFLALKPLINAWREFSRGTARIANFYSLLGASSALIGAGIEIGATTVAIHAGSRGNAAFATNMKIVAAKRGVALFGAGGAGLSAVADFVKSISAFNESNPQLGSMLIGSALAGGVVSVATWAGGVATAKALTSGGAVVVLGLNPAGWAIVAGIALVLIVGFAFGADMTKHGPIDIWLKHSVWGVDRRRYTNLEELNAFHGLCYRPRLTPEWNKSYGYSVGTLRISCQLPNTNRLNGEEFQTKLVVTLRGTMLSRVDGPIAYAPGSNPIDYRRECLVTPLGSTSSECGWSIQMDEDAEVALEYLYFPDPERQPNLALRQPDAPKALVFSPGGWLSDPIDSAKLEPVEGPK
ncbi:MAG: hypothetical protein ACN6OP_30865, partial [Pseudomonadales bacterium]